MKDIVKIDYVQEWADKLQAEGKSAWTVRAYVAAAIKVLDLDGTEVKLPHRVRANITRSRGLAARDVNFSPANHVAAITFCEATGLR